MAIISSLLAGGAEIAPDAGIKGILFRTIGSMVEKGVQTLMHDAETQIPTVKNLISQGMQTVRNVTMQTGLNEAGVVNTLSNEGQKVTAKQQEGGNMTQSIWNKFSTVANNRTLVDT